MDARLYSIPGSGKTSNSVQVIGPVSIPSTGKVDAPAVVEERRRPQFSDLKPSGGELVALLALVPLVRATILHPLAYAIVVGVVLVFWLAWVALKLYDSDR